MRQYMLNRKKANNYGFFCPDSRLHLTVSNPVGFADRVTPAIERALKSGTIIEVGVNPIEAPQQVQLPEPQGEPTAPAATEVIPEQNGDAGAAEQQGDIFEQMSQEPEQVQEPEQTHEENKKTTTKKGSKKAAKTE